MKILNILFNHKKSTHDNKILGVERCFVDYSRYLIKMNHQVISVVQDGVDYFDDILEEDYLKKMGQASRFDLLTMFRMIFLFIKFRPQIVICHSKKGFVIARIARFFSFSKSKIVAINHGVKIEKFLQADYVLSVNNYFTKKLVEAGMSQQNAIAIPNMIEVADDFEKITKSEFRSPLRIGSLGRLSGEKNFDKVLLAMKYLKDKKDLEVEFYIGGVGQQKEYLEKLATELGVRNNFKILDWVEDKKTFFKDIDIFILPSFEETFGIVLLEAMLYSTPIIASNSWGPDEIIEEGVNGLKVSKDDNKLMSELLAKAILKLQQDQDLARKIAENAHQNFFKKYEANIVMNKLEKLFLDIVKNNR